MISHIEKIMQLFRIIFFLINSDYILVLQMIGTAAKVQPYPQVQLVEKFDFIRYCSTVINKMNIAVIRIVSL